jgi:hypothetical protein
MATIFGVLGLNDNDYVSTADQRRVFDTINEYAARTEAEINAAFSVFVERDTTDYTATYYLPSGGMMQESAERTRPGAVKPVGTWDVAFPLRDARDQLAWTDISRAYMTAAKFDAQVKGIANRYLNWKRFHLLKALLNSTNETFVDPIYGSLTIRRLANGSGDSVVYPPVVGSTTEATENHYIETNYASSSISDTNNPIRDFVKPELAEHFGQGRYVAWINSAETAKISGLATFDPTKPDWVTPGATADIANADGVTGPGTFIGAIAGVAIFEWNWVPANYIVGVNLDAPKPLERRVDPIPSLQGFKLVAEQMEYPLNESFWRAREGYGVANRLNGVVVELGTGGTYTIPTLYA